MVFTAKTNADLTITPSNTSRMTLDTFSLKKAQSGDLFVAGDTYTSGNVFVGGNLLTTVTTSPTTTGTSGMAFDSNAMATGRGAYQINDGTANTYAIAALASDTPANGDIPQFNTGGTVTWETNYRSVELPIFDWTTDVTTGDGAYYFKVPQTLNGMNLFTVTSQLISSGTTGTTDVQLARCAATSTGNVCTGTVDDMLSTKLTIDSGENSSATAATPAVIDTAKDDVATGQIIRVDVDATHTTKGKGLIVTMDFQKP